MVLQQRNTCLSLKTPIFLPFNGCKACYHSTGRSCTSSQTMRRAIIDFVHCHCYRSILFCISCYPLGQWEDNCATQNQIQQTITQISKCAPVPLNTATTLHYDNYSERMTLTFSWHLRMDLPSVLCGKALWTRILFVSHTIRQIQDRSIFKMISGGGAIRKIIKFCD